MTGPRPRLHICIKHGLHTCKSGADSNSLIKLFYKVFPLSTLSWLIAFTRPEAQTLKTSLKYCAHMSYCMLNLSHAYGRGNELCMQLVWLSGIICHDAMAPLKNYQLKIYKKTFKGHTNGP